MKKFLSLVLALVMTMSLVTVSAGAKDFTDNSKITYDEAVMQSLTVTIDKAKVTVKALDKSIYTDDIYEP